MRLGIGGPLVVDPAEASLASPSDLMVLDLLYDGLTRLDADGVPQPALATDWEANDALTAFRFHLDPDATFASGRAVTSDDVIASLERVMAAGDSSLAALSLEAVKGFGAFADGRRRARQRAHRPGRRHRPRGADHPAVGAAESSCRARSSRWSTRPPWRATSATVDLSGAWTVASADDGDLVLDSRDRGRERRDDRAARLRRRGRRLRRRSRTVTSTGPQVPPSSYDAGGRGVRRRRLRAVPGRAVLRDERRHARRCARSARPPGDHAGDRPRRDRARRCTRTWPTRWPPWSPPASRATTRTAARRAPPTPSGPPTSSPSPTPTATCRRCTSTTTRRPPRRRWPSSSPTSLEAVGIPTELRPLPLDEYEAFVVSGEPGALQLRVDRRLRVARRLPRPAVRVVRQRQPHRLPVRRTWTLCSSDARASTEHRRERGAVGPGGGGDPRRPRSSCRSPSSASRWSSPTASRASSTAVDGTVDWAQVTLTELIPRGWPLRRGPATVTSPQGRPGGHVGVAELADAPA